MEITINNNGDLINTATQEKPVIQDTFTITNHNIDDPYKEVTKIVDTLQLINKLDSLTNLSNSLIELLEDNDDLLVENDLEDNINSTQKFYDNAYNDIKELKEYRDKFFVSDNNKKEKLTVKQLKYILSNKRAENVLKMNILTQLHHGSVVNDELNISDKINTVYNQLNTVYSELCTIIDNIKYSDDLYEEDDEYDDYYDEDDYYEDDYDEYDDEDDYNVNDIDDNSISDHMDYDNMSHNELIHYIEELQSKYLKLQEDYKNLDR